MPLTQVRMIALIRAAREYQEVHRGFAQLAIQFAEDVVRGELSPNELPGMLIQLQNTQRVSEEAVDCIAREETHFKLSASKNNYNAAYIARQRQAKAAGTWKRLTPEERAERHVTRAGLQRRAPSTQGTHSQFQPTAEGQALSLGEIEELRGQAYEREAQRAVHRHAPRIDTKQDGEIISGQSTPSAEVYDPNKLGEDF